MLFAQTSMANRAGTQMTNAALTPTQAVNIWILHWRGQPIQQISARLGVNPLRVRAVLDERQHPGSRERARKVQLR